MTKFRKGDYLILTNRLPTEIIWKVVHVYYDEYILKALKYPMGGFEIGSNHLFTCRYIDMYYTKCNYANVLAKIM